jgi:hypothetical protein
MLFAEEIGTILVSGRAQKSHSGGCAALTMCSRDSALACGHCCNGASIS